MRLQLNSGTLGGRRSARSCDTPLLNGNRHEPGVGCPLLCLPDCWHRLVLDLGDRLVTRCSSIWTSAHPPSHHRRALLTLRRCRRTPSCSCVSQRIPNWARHRPLVALSTGHASALGSLERDQGSRPTVVRVAPDQRRRLLLRAFDRRGRSHPRRTPEQALTGRVEA